MGLYLGIDQSLRGAGFALADELGGYVRSTTVSVGEKATGAERLFLIGQAFEDFVGVSAVLGVAAEGYSVNSVNRPFDLGAVSGVLRYLSYRRFGVETLEVPPKSLKLYVAGHGAADKDLILYTVKTVWGVDLGKRDDEADAFGLARFAWTFGTGRFSRRCEAEAVHAISPGSLRPPKKRIGRPRTPNV